MDPLLEKRLLLTRRHFFGRAAAGIGTAALTRPSFMSRRT